MRLFHLTMTRRGFLLAGAALALNTCRPRGQRLAADAVLADLRENPVIQNIRRGRVILLHKDVEGLTLNGRQALTIVQRGLFALGLVGGTPASFNFGVYGPRTERGLRYLQAWGGVDASVGRNGRRFEANTLLILESALERQIAGDWRPPRDF